MFDRTELQKLTAEPLELELGGETYFIKPPKITASMAWKSEFRKKFPDTYDVISSGEFMQAGEQVASNWIITVLKETGDMSEEMLKLLQLLCPGLNPEHVMKTAYEMEVLIAMAEVITLVFPLFGLVKVQDAKAKAKEEAEAKAKTASA